MRLRLLFASIALGISLPGASCALPFWDYPAEKGGGGKGPTSVASTMVSSATGCGDTVTDAKNCGMCGHDCRFGQCMAGRCQPYQIVSATNVPTSATDDSPIRLAVDRDNVYWVDAGADRVLSIAKSGAGMAKLLYAPTPTNPYDIATDGDASTAAQNVYFVTESAGAYVLSLSTPPPATLGSSGHGLRLVLAAGYVFWTYQNHIYRYRLPSMTVDTIAVNTEAWGSIHDLASDGTALYWSDATAGKLYTAPLGAAPNCGEADACVEVGPSANNIDMIAVDAKNAYWTEEDATSRQIWKVSKTNGSVVTLATLPKTTAVIKTLLSDGANLYWTDDVTNAVHTTRVDATAPCDDVTLTCAEISQATEGMYPTGIAQDDKAIYWSFLKGPGGTGPGTIWAIAK